MPPLYGMALTNAAICSSLCLSHVHSLKTVHFRTRVTIEVRTLTANPMLEVEPIDAAMKPSPALRQKHSLGVCTIQYAPIELSSAGAYRFDARYLVMLAVFCGKRFASSRGSVRLRATTACGRYSNRLTRGSIYRHGKSV